MAAWASTSSLRVNTSLRGCRRLANSKSSKSSLSFDEGAKGE
jgi:hypothetical protein